MRKEQIQADASEKDPAHERRELVMKVIERLKKEDLDRRPNVGVSRKRDFADETPEGIKNIEAELLSMNETIDVGTEIARRAIIAAPGAYESNPRIAVAVHEGDHDVKLAGEVYAQPKSADAPGISYGFNLEMHFPPGMKNLAEAREGKIFAIWTLYRGMSKMADEKGLQGFGYKKSGA